MGGSGGSQTRAHHTEGRLQSHPATSRRRGSRIHRASRSECTSIGALTVSRPSAAQALSLSQVKHHRARNARARWHRSCGRGDDRRVPKPADSLSAPWLRALTRVTGLLARAVRQPRAPPAARSQGSCSALSSAHRSLSSMCPLTLSLTRNPARRLPQTKVCLPQTKVCLPQTKVCLPQTEVPGSSSAHRWPQADRRALGARRASTHR